LYGSHLVILHYEKLFLNPRSTVSETNFLKDRACHFVTADCRKLENTAFGFVSIA
jgi:hypothetical protein